MITAYHRPETLEQALALIARAAPMTLPLGGGTLLSHPDGKSLEVVDLQHLGLDQIKKRGRELEIGATVTLQRLLEGETTPDSMKGALKLEAPLNIRNAATAAGDLMAADGRSTFACCLLALDAKIVIQPNDEEMQIGNFLPLRGDTMRGRLITKIVLLDHAKLAFEYVARTPADKPLVCAALAVWPSGRTRLAVGGWGKTPLLAMDGTEAEGLESAARNALHEAMDEWASAEYRQEIAATLAKRCLKAIGKSQA